VRRSARPLPSYTRRKWLKGAQVWAYYFEVPTWARKPSPDDLRGSCGVRSEELGIDYVTAVRRVESFLLPQFESWRTYGLTDIAPSRVRCGTLDWLFAEYRATDAFKELDRKTRKLHQGGFDLVGKYQLKDGRALGSINVNLIDTSVVDPLYEKLRFVPVINDDGTPHLDTRGGSSKRERRTTVNHAMKSCRRAWNVVLRRHPKVVPPLNPFAKMGLKGSSRKTPTATYADLLAAVACADTAGIPSLGTAMMVTWEWLQREEHIFTAFHLSHYRPKDRPDEVLVVHPKNGEAIWIPLFDSSGAKLFPELMTRMDALKRDRVGGLMFVRDWPDKAMKVPLSWATEKGGLDFVRKKSKMVIRIAGLAPELSFTSFRHGGLTELGDADLTDAQIRALSRHKSAKQLPTYIKRTRNQIIAGTQKRRRIRAETDPNNVPTKVNT
jgi:hypothetical protein